MTKAFSAKALQDTITEQSNIEYKNLEIDVLEESLAMYKQDLEQRIHKLETGVKMENKSINTQETEMNMMRRMEALENTLRRLEMEPEGQPTDTDASDEIADYMRTGKLESKSISTDGDKGLKLNKGLISKIFDGMKKQYSLLKQVNVLETNSRVTTLNVINKETNSAKFIDENQDWADSFKPEFASVDVKLKACVAVVDIHRSLLEDMDNNALLDWVNGRVINDFGKVINEALRSDRNDAFENLLKHRDDAGAMIDAPAKKLNAGNILPDLLSLVASLPDQYLADAAWYMSSEAFRAILSADKEIIKHLTPGNEDGVSYKLFGKSVFLIDLPNTHNVMFANLKEGYTILKHSNVTFSHAMKDAFAEKVRYVYRMRLGGAVTNKNAFVFSNIDVDPVAAAPARA